MGARRGVAIFFNVFHHYCLHRSKRLHPKATSRTMITLHRLASSNAHHCLCTCTQLLSTLCLDPLGFSFALARRSCGGFTNVWIKIANEAPHKKCNNRKYVTNFMCRPYTSAPYRNDCTNQKHYMNKTIFPSEGGGSPQGTYKNKKYKNK